MSHVIVNLESGGRFCIEMWGADLFKFTQADRVLLGAIADAVQRHGGAKKPTPQAEQAVATQAANAEVVEKAGELSGPEGNSRA